MSQQEYLGLRAINFPVFPAYAESTTHDTKTGYRSYSRAPVESGSDSDSAAASSLARGKETQGLSWLVRGGR